MLKELKKIQPPKLIRTGYPDQPLSDEAAALVPKAYALWNEKQRITKELADIEKNLLNKVSAYFPENLNTIHAIAHDVKVTITLRFNDKITNADTLRDVLGDEFVYYVKTNYIPTSGLIDLAVTDKRIKACIESRAGKPSLAYQCIRCESK